MVGGTLNCDAGSLNFERDLKTGHRKGNGQGIYTFSPSPKLTEHPIDWEIQKWFAGKDSNTISAVFFCIFTDLMRVKPSIKFI